MKKRFKVSALCAFLAAPFLAAQTGPQTNGYIYTYAGNGVQGSSGDGGPAINAELFQAAGLAADAAGNLYIADSYNNRIRKVDSATGDISTVAGSATGGFSGDGGPAIGAELSHPSSVAFDGAGNLYISDSQNGVIRRVDAVTGIITTVAGSKSLEGFGGDGGPAIDAGLASPAGIAFDREGNLFINDNGDYRIREVNASTSIIQTVVGTGVAGFAGDGGPATKAEIFTDGSLVLDASGNLIFADTGNSCIRRVDKATGIITTVAGVGHTGPFGEFGGDGGPATSAQLYQPLGVTLDGVGNIYIADSVNDRIRRVDSSTGIITTVAGDGDPIDEGDGGPAIDAGIFSPEDVVVDPSGNLYVSESSRVRIVRNVALPGTVTTLVAAPTVLALGQPLTLTATVTAVSGATPTGTVTFYAVSTPLGSAALNNSGVAQFTITPGAGKYTITASYSGSSTDAASVSSPPQDVTVVAITTATTLSASSTSLPAGQPLTLTAKVTAVSGATPTGTVSFVNGPTPLGAAMVDANGMAALSLTPAAGSYSIVAQYGGSSTDASSASAPPISVTVAAATTGTSLSASSTILPTGQPVTLTATVTAAMGAVPTGTVSFLNGATLLGSGPLNAGGLASLTLSPNPGTYSITASYGGSTADAPSVSSPPLTVTVTALDTITTLESSLNPAPFGAAVVFTATVKGPKLVSPTGAPEIPTGTVSFYDGATLLGTTTLASGMCTFSTSGLIVGQHSITAAYSATAGFAASTSSPLVEVILPATFTLSATPASRTVYTGQAASYNVVVKPGTGFDLSVTFSCTQLPANATCSFSPASVMGANWSTTLTVQTDAPHPVETAASMVRRAGAIGAAGLLLFLIPSRLRRNRATWYLTLMIVSVGVATSVLSACSAPANLTGGTPLGALPITVTGVAGNGSQTVTAKATLNLNVQSLF